MSMSGAMDGVAHALSGLLSQAGAVGDSGTWYNRNDSGYTVYFAWGTSALLSADTFAGTIADIEEASVTIPKQTGMTGNEPSPGDLLAASGGDYWRCVDVKKLGLPQNPCAYVCRMQREPELNKVT